MTRRCDRRGFTLVELLVVLGILTLLAGIILPAVQKAREANNRLLCASNLRQLGLAAHHFHQDHGRLPPGYLGPSLEANTDRPRHFYQGQWVGHFPLLLPYLEQDSLARLLDIDFRPEVVTELPWFWKPGPVSHAGNYTAGMTRLRIFRCPSSAEYTPEVEHPGPGGGGTILGTHTYNSPEVEVETDGWIDDYVRSRDYRFLGRSNYAGVAGCGTGTHPFFARFEGIYTNRSKNTLGQLTAQDGASNTLFYGETSGSRWNGSRPDTVDLSWMGAGALGTFGGLRRARDAETTHFSSHHAAGVQFCFADGSVRTLRFGETFWSGGPFPRDWLVLQQLGGWRDGERSPTDALLD
jgi:prepilin-type N-terminal cleavage/methylation domain-containing protein